MIMIKIDNVQKTYKSHHALRGVSLSMNEGEEYLIRGSSGSGKSTLLYLLGGLDRPTSGHIVVNQKNLNDLSDEALALYRNKFVGFVFQFHFLLPSLSAYDNIMLPAKLGGVNASEVESHVRNLAKTLGVTALLDKFPFELSGGEQQRINIIRALSLRPKLLLCDEPTGNLDSENSKKVIELLRNLSKEYNSTLVIVTHDLEIASTFKKQFVMQDGVILTH